MIDIIGDVHGHADELEMLLQNLGYTRQNDFYSHPSRKALFVGDYIDRGPQIRETLEIVKQMADNGSAIALMGNHEYNAICFAMHKKEGGHLREHSIKNIIQHYETLKQFQNKQAEYKKYINWFKTLPLFYESSSFRAVHACWDEENIAFLKQKLKDNCFTEALIRESTEKGTTLHNAIEETLKGKELELPNGQSFNDKDGNRRTAIRIKWWENPQKMTYKQISVSPNSELPDLPVAAANKDLSYYKADKKPVFFGHYWLKGKPLIEKNNICCLDYSVAKNGRLVAYSFKEETVLEENNFTSVEAYSASNTKPTSKNLSDNIVST